MLSDVSGRQSIQVVHLPQNVVLFEASTQSRQVGHDLQDVHPAAYF